MSASATSVLPVQVETRRDVAGRQGLIWQLLSDALVSVAVPGVTPSVLDCGGGSGSFAVPLAQAGALVTVVDISVDALATLRRRAEDAGVGERVEALQGDVEALADALGERGAGSFDLVLAHGILGAVDDLPAAFAAIAGCVRPGGQLSVLVGNPVAAVLARALAGDLTGALDELRALPSKPGPETVRTLCRAHGLLVEGVHGIGVFGEFVPGRALDAPGAREALDQLEAGSAGDAPFRDIAARVHLLARRPAG